MKRRWKVGIALAVVGLAAFLVWAFRTASAAPLTIGFQGHVTNNDARIEQMWPPLYRPVLAVFAVTNHTSRTLAVFASFQTVAPGVTNGELGWWMNSTNFVDYFGSKFPLITPGESVLVAAGVLSTTNLVTMSVRNQRPPGGNTWWERLSRRLFGYKSTHWVLATNKPP